jgi:hypothetical protein
MPFGPFTFGPDSAGPKLFFHKVAVGNAGALGSSPFSTRAAWRG